MSAPPAFPIVLSEIEERGMTLRDYFAAAALTGIFAGDGLAALLDNAKKGKDHDPLIAFAAYELADAMLAERGKKP